MSQPESFHRNASNQRFWPAASGAVFPQHSSDAPHESTEATIRVHIVTRQVPFPNSWPNVGRRVIHQICNLK